jgi:hypothetical protein
MTKTNFLHCFQYFIQTSMLPFKLRKSWTRDGLEMNSSLLKHLPCMPEAQGLMSSIVKKKKLLIN